MSKHRRRNVWNQMVTDGFYWIAGLTISVAAILAMAPTVRDFINS